MVKKTLALPRPPQYTKPIQGLKDEEGPEDQEEESQADKNATNWVKIN